MNKNLKKKFHSKGYFKIKILPKNIINQFNNELAKSIKLIIERKLKYKKKYRTNNKSWLVNDGLITLDKEDHKLFVEIYDQIPRSHIFFNIINHHKIINIVNELLERPKHNNLYINPASLRMDVPKNYKFSYGWHRDNNSNIPNSKFIQIWCPLINNIDLKLGGLHILNESHKYNLNTTSSKLEKELLSLNKTVRPKLNTKVHLKDSFQEEIITAKIGEVVFFNSALMHKSGLNKTKNKIRYVLAAFYHDTTNKEWDFFYRNHKS